MTADAMPAKKADAGAPAWVMTFADLMSLLMTFFVLLLSFSEMDALKFKQVAGSMEFAFGVQRDIRAKEIPKGTSIIAKEFSPGKPDPSALAQVRQYTTEEMQRFLRLDENGKDPLDKGGGKGKAGNPDQSETGGGAGVRFKEVYVQVEADASALQQAFEEEIGKGLIDIETRENRVIIRIREKGSFPSGSATMNTGFKPIIKKLGTIMHGIKGKIVVAGHTDDVPISTARFRSNWELSAARAVSVLLHLREANDIGDDRLLIEAYADSRPLVPNDSAENRARNRRVEIIIEQSPEDVSANKSLMDGVGASAGAQAGSASPTDAKKAHGAAPKV